MKFNEIVEILSLTHKDEISILDEKEVLIVNPEIWFKLASLIKNNPKLKFDYLMCISSYDKGDDIAYGAAYNFYSTSLNHYLEVRIEVKDGESIPSIVSLWKAADWHEREAFDMMGLNFNGHPDLKRILLSDDWDGHPRVFLQVDAEKTTCPYCGTIYKLMDFDD